MSKKKILIVNGPNINLLGQREKNVYGELTYKDLQTKLIKFKVKNMENILCALLQHRWMNYLRNKNLLVVYQLC